MSFIFKKNQKVTFYGKENQIGYFLCLFRSTLLYKVLIIERKYRGKEVSQQVQTVKTLKYLNVSCLRNATVNVEDLKKLNNKNIRSRGEKYLIE